MLFGAVGLIVLPVPAPDAVVVAALVGVVILIIAGGRVIWKKPPLAFWFVPLAAVCLVPVMFILWSFGRLDLMAILFHANFGIAGATLAGLEMEALKSVLFPAALVFSIYVLTIVIPLSRAMLIAAALGILAINPMTHFVASWVMSPSIESNLVQELEEPKLTPQGVNDPDLVILYLEGSDRQFSDRNIWGDIYAPLNTFSSESLVFTNVGQIEGTGWSIAGMVASQCGVPVLPNGFLWGQNLNEVETFMPELTCLGDVLADRNYSSAFIVGADRDFGGSSKFYQTHGITNQTGGAEISKLYSVEEFASAVVLWMTDDQMVFETSIRKADEMWQEQTPVALILETSGPHGHEGFLSRACTDSGRAEASEDIVSMVSCLLTQTEQFLDTIRARHAELRPNRDLRIVVLSDHLFHDPHTPQAAPGLKGYNTVIFWGDGEGIVEKPGSMIDIYSTMLDWLGWAEKPVAAGLGRSLLSDPPTLVEHHGKDQFDAMLRVDGELANEIWRNQ